MHRAAADDDLDPLTSTATRGGGRRGEERDMEGGGGERAAGVVRRLMAAKAESRKSFSEIGEEAGLTNVYVAQLLRRQAQLKPETAPALRAAVPGLTDDLVALMMEPPFRSYHPDIVHEPAIYRCLLLPFPPMAVPYSASQLSLASDSKPYMLMLSF